MRRLLPLVLLCALAADQARASCGPPMPRAQLKYADAAFDGTFESSRREGESAWFIFRVHRVFKGRLADRVEVFQHGVSPINFRGLAPGERVGLMINFADGRWHGNECLRYDPDELADAVKPLPRPPGRGSAAFLVTGSFGDATAALLDRRGRTLAYAFGVGDGASPCPGGRRIAMLGGRRIRLLRTRDLRLIETRNAGSTRRIHCLGDVVVRATATGLLRGDRRIWRGTWTGMTFHRRFAYVAQDRAIVRVDLVSGRERPLATLDLPPEHEPLQDLALSPDGRHLAVWAPNAAVGEGEPPSRVALVEGGGRVRTTDAPRGYGAPVWISRGRFALVADSTARSQPPPPARVFDTELRARGETAPTGLPAVGFGGDLVGMAGHRLMRGGSELGRLPASWVSGLHRLPGVKMRAPRRLPRF